MSLPMKFDTLVGDMGSTLSGGQVQRILLARAIYKKPQLLLLDEATSHLDAENEKIINYNIRKSKLTTVLIAHRKESIALCDRTIELN